MLLRPVHLRGLAAALAGALLVATLATVGPTVDRAAAVAAPPDTCDALAWEGEVAGDERVFVAAADGTERLDLAQAMVGFPPSGNERHTWSPDGTRIAWSGVIGPERYVISASAEDGSDTVVVSAAEPGPDPSFNIDPAYSPDGSRIAWVGDDGANEEVFVADVDGTNRIEISSVGFGQSPTSNRSPDWSPDGARIAWVGYLGPDQHVFVADADGSNGIVLSALGLGPTSSNKRAPAWSPDGTSIMWWGSGKIIVAPVDGGERLELSAVGPGPHPMVASEPQWSPDGDRVVWAQDPGDRQIVVADADGTNRTVVSDVGPDPAPEYNSTPTWSPDGSRIAWVAGLDSEEIWVADADGTDRSEIAAVGDGVDPINIWRPIWRPRSGEADLAVTATGPFVVGSIAEVTVTVSSECGLGGVRVAHVVPPCFAEPVVTASTGSYDGISDWEVGLLHGTEEATVRGTVTDAGDCSFTTDVLPLTVPVLAAPVGATTALAATQPACASPPPPFLDVASTSFAYADIACIAGLGITTGTGPTTYDPAGLVTREQMAAFLGRTRTALNAGCPAVPTPFTDVATTSFALDHVGCLYGLGITTGTGPTTYDPAGLVTREQMAAFLGRSWLTLGGTCPSDAAPFTDVAATSFAAAHVDCIWGLGITTGTGPTTYDPAGPVTREQMAAFLGRFWRTAVDAGLHVS